MAEFPTYEQMAKNVAEKALDEILYQGKSIREWAKIITEQEPCEDAISRAEAIKAMESLEKSDIEAYGCPIPEGFDGKRAIESLKKLPPVTLKQETVTEFADRCRECGAKYGKLLKQKSGEWIPVSERPPENKTYVLTTIKVPNRIAHVRSGWFEGGFFHNDNGDTWKATDREVIAWMPLAEPYKESEEQKCK